MMACSWNGDIGADFQITPTGACNGGPISLAAGTTSPTPEWRC